MASKRKRENGKVQKNIAKVFLVILIIFLIGNFLMPAKSYSEKEREQLAVRPKLSWTALWTGTYMDDYEAYLEDQFIGKSILRDLAAPLGFVSGSSIANDVYYGKSRQLLEDIAVPEESELRQNLEAISAFAEENSDIQMCMMIVPDAAQIWQDKLPLFAQTADQAGMIRRVQKTLEDQIAMIDVASVFSEHANEKLYYQTDYHWTSLGAYYAFQAAASALDIPADGLSDFVSYTVTSNFTGALSARSGYLESVKEDVSIYVPGGRSVEVVVNYVDEGKKTTSIFSSEELEEKDKYQVFLGEDSPVVDIRTTADNDRKLLILKDSSANSFVQFLIPYYREIILVDTELYEGNAEDLLRTYRISDVLFLYRGNTFFGENHLSGVLINE